MRSAVLLFSLLLLLGVAARAGDGEPPRLEYEQVVAAFPAATSERAFAWQGVVEAQGTRVGSFALEAKAVSEGQWQLAERVSIAAADARTAWEADLRVDRRLVPVRGVLKETDELGDALTHTWKAAEEGYRVETRSAARTPMQRTARKQEPSLCGLASLALFARLVPAEPGTCTTRVFHPEWEYLEAERPFVPVALTVTLADGGEGRQILEVRAVEGKTEVRVLLDAASRDLVEIRIRGRAPADLTLEPAQGPPDGTSEDLFAEPSTTPRGCAARVALAFATVDVDHFDRLVHWPTLRRNMKASIRGDLTDEAFREKILDQFREQGRGREPQAREEAQAFIREQAEGFGVETRGADDAVVTLGAAWGGMRLTLRKVENGWRLVRLPGA